MGRYRQKLWTFEHLCSHRFCAQVYIEIVSVRLTAEILYRYGVRMGRYRQKLWTFEH